MLVIVIGVEPPCPRCERLYMLAKDIVKEIKAEAEVKKIPFDSDEARRLGRVGTAHDITEWADMQMDWCGLRGIVTDGWSQELDDFLMPCKIKADEQGWLMTPVLVVNNEVICSGYVPEKEFIRSALHKKLKLGGNL